MAAESSCGRDAPWAASQSAVHLQWKPLCACGLQVVQGCSDSANDRHPMGAEIEVLYPGPRSWPLALARWGWLQHGPPLNGLETDRAGELLSWSELLQGEMHMAVHLLEMTLPAPLEMILWLHPAAPLATCKWVKRVQAQHKGVAHY